jgi:hypothetical protein
MNELERAARDLVAHPAGAPLPLAELQRRAAGIRRRSQATRLLTVAAVLVVVLGVVGAGLAHRSGDVEVSVGATDPGPAGSTSFDVSWTGTIDASSVAALLRDRLAAYGATGVEIDPRPNGASGLVHVHADGIDGPTASLLVTTVGQLATADATAIAASSADATACHNTLAFSSGSLPRGVPVLPVVDADPLATVTTGGWAVQAGWPIRKPLDTCYRTGDGQVLNGTAAAPASAVQRVDVTQQGKTWSAAVVLDSIGDLHPKVIQGATASRLEICAATVPATCTAIFLDGIPAADPGPAPQPPKGEDGQVTFTTDGFRLNGLTEASARAFAAVIEHPLLPAGVHLIPHLSGDAPAPSKGTAAAGGGAAPK